MNTQEEVDSYYTELTALKAQAPDPHGLAFARTLDDAHSTALLAEDEALEMLEAHGVQTQISNGQLQALSIWTDKQEGGGIGSEWVNVVCRRNWLRAFLGY